MCAETDKTERTTKQRLLSTASTHHNGFCRSSEILASADKAWKDDGTAQNEVPLTTDDITYDYDVVKNAVAESAEEESGVLAVGRSGECVIMGRSGGRLLVVGVLTCGIIGIGSLGPRDHFRSTSSSLPFRFSKVLVTPSSEVGSGGVVVLVGCVVDVPTSVGIIA